MDFHYPDHTGGTVGKRSTLHTSERIPLLKLSVRFIYFLRVALTEA
jgi:hypothetical protein